MAINCQFYDCSSFPFFLSFVPSIATWSLYSSIICGYLAEVRTCHLGLQDFINKGNSFSAFFKSPGMCFEIRSRSCTLSYICDILVFAVYIMQMWNNKLSLGSQYSYLSLLAVLWNKCQTVIILESHGVENSYI